MTKTKSNRVASTAGELLRGPTPEEQMEREEHREYATFNLDEQLAVDEEALELVDWNIDGAAECDQFGQYDQAAVVEVEEDEDD